MYRQKNLSSLVIERLKIFTSLFIMLLVVFSGCKKKPTPEPDPVPPTGKGTISVSIPQEQIGFQFMHKLFSVEGGALALDKTVAGAFSSEVAVGRYSLYAVKYSDNGVSVSEPTSLNAALVANKEAETGRIVPISEDVLWASAPLVEIKEAQQTDVTLAPSSALRYLDFTITVGAPYSGYAVRGILNGISDSFSLSTGKANVESSKEVVFSMVESTPGVFIAKVGIFGVANKPEGGYKLSLEITKDGKVLGCSSDVSPQITIATDKTIPIRAVMAPVIPEVPKTPIKLYASVISTGSARSVVTDLEGKNVGVASGPISGSYGDLWSGKVLGEEIVLSPERYYPADNSALYLCGFYPFANPDANGNVHYNLTGSEDLMWAGEKSGSLNTPFTPTTSVLEYNHLLAQFNFSIEILDKTKEYSLREISLIGISNSAVLSLANGTTAFGPSTVTKQLYSAGLGSGLPIINGHLSLNNSLYVQPNAVLKTNIVLSVDDDRTHDITLNNIDVAITGGSTGGTAYEIKLTFQNPSVPPIEGVGVNVSAKVAKWREGASGEAEAKP